MVNTLVLYSYNAYPPRTTHLENLYSFKNYSANHHVYCLNLATHKSIPRYIQDFPWRLIIIHDLFLSQRHSRGCFPKVAKRVSAFLQSASATKVMTVQDEFINMDIVNDFIRQNGISHVFSAANPSEWSKLYKDADKLNIEQVLTGYIDDNAIRKAAQYNQETRPIDIGYRASHPSLSLGAHALLKYTIAEAFKSKAAGLKIDISNDPKDVLTGDDWCKFLLSCKYQLGVETGASILDWDGRLMQQAHHGKTQFSEEGNLSLKAIGPRHFDACVTKTCQILVEGEYSGILKPWEHYIPLKKDFSNIDEVLNLVREDKLRKSIAERAYKDIVASDNWSYRKFVRQVTLPAQDSGADIRIGKWLDRRLLLDDRLSWLTIAFKSRLWQPVAIVYYKLSLLLYSILKRINAKNNS